MFKSIIFFSVSVFFALMANAQSVTNILSCAQSSGSLLHKISQNNEGNYLAYINLPVHFKKVPQDIIEKSKKEWSTWDGTIENRPADMRKIGVSVPLENSNVFNFDIKRLAEKALFFDSLFPPIENSSHIPSSFGFMAIRYLPDECQIVEAGNLMEVYCSNSEPITINNIIINRRTLELSAQVTSEVNINPETGETQIIKTHKVSTNLTLQAQQGSNVRNYRVAYTYVPNSDSVQCHIKEKMLVNSGL